MKWIWRNIALYFGAVFIVAVLWTWFTDIVLDVHPPVLVSVVIGYAAGILILMRVDVIK